MYDLKNKLALLKKKISDKGEEDKKTRTEVKKALEEIFDDPKIPDTCLRDFYLKSNNLIIVTTNKSFANELFIRKEELLKKLTKTMPVKEIIIK